MVAPSWIEAKERPIVRESSSIRQSQNVKICITCAAESFLFGTRYLFPWFGFSAKEFTCANLKLKGDQLQDSLPGGSYVSTKRNRFVPSTFHTCTFSWLRERQQFSPSPSAPRRRL